MTSYLLGRFARMPALALGVATVVFFLIHFVPGDPVDLMLGETALPTQREELRKELHLDEPIVSQYARFLGGALKGDLGTSLVTGEAVSDRLVRAAPLTLKLAFWAMVISLLVALPAGIVSAARTGTVWDVSVMSFSLAGLCMPTFLLGPVLILFLSVKLDWLPVSGSDEPLSVLLPALTLGLGMTALVTRMTRSAAKEVSKELYVRTARAKGASSKRVWGKHILRNALLPVVTVVGLQTGSLLSGSLITEKIFSWPGVGFELTQAIERRDYPMVQGAVLLIAMTYMAVNLLTDVTYAWLDPRIRLNRSKGKS